MKIGIATFQWADNYGALLQAYALQSFLQSMGHDVEIINYQPQKPLNGIRRYVSSSLKSTLTNLEIVYKKKYFEKFRVKYFIRSRDIFYTAKDLEKIKSSYDLMISGSDQVWNPIWLIQQDGLWDFCFLRFAGESTKIVSYAASFGHRDISTIIPEWQKRIKRDLLRFDFISVREETGVDIVSKISGRNDAICVIDPTMLHPIAFYNILAGKRKNRTPYLFSYKLHGFDNLILPLEQIINGKLNLKILKCNAKNSFTKRGYVLPGPTDWLRHLRDAEFVITNSYHAVVFCLIFHTPFIAVKMDGEMGSMNTRIESLLNKVGLASKYIYTTVDNDVEKILSPINWKTVDMILNIDKSFSVDFINKIL